MAQGVELILTRYDLYGFKNSMLIWLIARPQDLMTARLLVTLVTLAHSLLKALLMSNYYLLSSLNCRIVYRNDIYPGWKT